MARPPLLSPWRGYSIGSSGVAEALVAVGAPLAPLTVQNEAIVRLAAYLYDQPTSSAGDRYGAAWRNSGAESLTTRFVQRRAVVGVSEDTGGVSVARVREIIREELAAALRGVLVWR